MPDLRAWLRVEAAGGSCAVGGLPFVQASGEESVFASEFAEDHEAAFGE